MGSPTIHVRPVHMAGLCVQDGRKAGIRWIYWIRWTVFKNVIKRVIIQVIKNVTI